MVYADWEVFISKYSLDFIVKLIADVGHFEVELFLILGRFVFELLDSLLLVDGFHEGGWVVVFQEDSFEGFNVFICIFLL